MLKKITLIAAVVLSAQAFANGGGGAPGGNCYIDGEYAGNMSLPECTKKGGELHWTKKKESK